MRAQARSSLLSLALFSLAAGCSANGSGSSSPGGGGAGGQGGGGFDASLDATTDGAGGSTEFPDPKSCAEAAAGSTYLGCDFWPTVLDNVVNPNFDFAVVVANTSDDDAAVEVSRAGAPVDSATVPAHGLAKIYLPWVEELKSSASIFPGCPTNVKTSTVAAKGGAYHLTSSRPVAVYQFNAIEYAGKGGPPGKDWTTICSQLNCAVMNLQCFSYTNDASLLLPSTALTGTYRVAGPSGWTSIDDSNPERPSSFTYPPYFGVTGTVDGTEVTVRASATARVAAGGGVPAIGPGGTATFRLDAGDVVMVVGDGETDLSGSLVTATAPVQVIAGISCSYLPHDVPACDHLEETVAPAETLGQRYFVTRPTSPEGDVSTHIVRFYGNVDGTTLSYPGANPGGPTRLDAGDVVELVGVSRDFEVVGDHAFAVASFMHGENATSAGTAGDPSQTFMTTVEQYRRNYVFLAPDDYETSYADVVAPAGAALLVDGVAPTQTPTPISSGFEVTRIGLDPSTGGAHTLVASAPVGLQVMGYGSYTSYQYPGGLNLGRISPVPVK